MKSPGWSIEKLIAACLAMLLAVPSAGAISTPQQESAPMQQSQNSTSRDGSSQVPTPGAGVPDASTASLASTQNEDPNQASSQNTNRSNQSDQSPPSGPAPQQNSATPPVGTAAAPYERGIGISASRPAGAAIAPARQRRALSFVIKIGLVVGAGVALGTVVALSHSSPSQPH